MLASGNDESMNTSIEAEQRFELPYYGETDSYKHGNGTLWSNKAMWPDYRIQNLFGIELPIIDGGAHAGKW